MIPAPVILLRKKSKNIDNIYSISMADDSNSEKDRRLLPGQLNNEIVLCALSGAIVLHLAVWVNPCR